MKTIKINALLIVMSLIVATFAVACDDKKDPATSAAPVAQSPSENTDEHNEDESAQAADEDEEELEGQWVNSKLYDVKFLVPEDWVVDGGEEGVSATAPDGTTTVILVGSESENMLQAAINDLKSNIELKDIRFEKSGLTTINGLAGQRGSGAAVLVKESGDQEIQFLAYSLRVGRNTVTMMIFSEAEMYEAQRDMIQGISQTITRL